MKRGSGHFGFTLVEVVLALGLAAFCLITVFTLLPIGLNSNQNSIEETAAANMARAIVSDLRRAPVVAGATCNSTLFNIPIPPAGPAPSPGPVLYFREDGSVAQSGTGPVSTAVNADPSQTPRYRASLYFFPPPVSSGSLANKTATSVRILITWPALADPVYQKAPGNFTGSYETMTALDRN